MKYAQWTIYGLLAARRSDSSRNPSTISYHCKGLLVIPLYGDLVFDIHLAMENLAVLSTEGLQCCGARGLKIKNEMRDLAKKATEKCAEIRRERRSFLIGEMSVLVGLFHDIPGLIAPKFPMAIAALSMSQAECLLFFSHLNLKVADIPKARSKLYKVDDFSDPQISQLVGIHMQLAELARRHADMIQAYYKEYVQTAHRHALMELTKDLKGVARPGLQQIIDSLPKQLEPGQHCDLRAFRLDWARARYHRIAGHLMS